MSNPIDAAETGYIPKRVYDRISKLLPVLCVDILLINERGQYLLVKRTNEPLQGRYWVVGGRVHKGESIWQAAKRKVKEEVGVEISALHFLGFNEGVFRLPSSGLDATIHTVSVVFRGVVQDGTKIKLDSQASRWKFVAKPPRNFLLNLAVDEDCPRFD